MQIAFVYLRNNSIPNSFSSLISDIAFLRTIRDSGKATNRAAGRSFAQLRSVQKVSIGLGLAEIHILRERNFML